MSTIIAPPGNAEEIFDLVGGGTEPAVSAMGLLNGYSHIFVIAFVVTLLATPLVRRLAIAANVIDHPDQVRKQHAYPVAYLGGVAVFLGLITAIGVSYVTVSQFTEIYSPVPIAVIIGMMAILLTGLADDVWGWDPRLKIAGQLVAAAALAINDIGVRVAEGLLAPLMGSAHDVLITVGSFEVLNGHVFYWTGTAIIAFFVLGGCNSANLIDGLDGLLSGVVAIVAIGLLAISLLMVPDTSIDSLLQGEDSLAGARIVLCAALLGSVLGFLPHNFKPATIFLGDGGSLLIGFLCATIILMLGERGQTHLVFAGLIVFAVPIMDTTLAIIRRWLAGTSMSAADDQHMHHQLCRAMGGVKLAVLILYGISVLFAVIGVTMAWLIMRTELRVRVMYAIALVLFSFIGVTAVKAARRQQLAKAPASAPARTSSEESSAAPHRRSSRRHQGQTPRLAPAIRSGRRLDGRAFTTALLLALSLRSGTISVMEHRDPIRVLFICMGNICRSPLAEGVFVHKARQRGLSERFLVDSAGLGGWHAGEPPDPRARAVAAANQVTLSSRARQIQKPDFETFDHLICMDEENHDRLLTLGAPIEKLRLLLELDPRAPMREVPDPYYGGQDGFELVFRLIDSACDALLDQLTASVRQ